MYFWLAHLHAAVGKSFINYKQNILQAEYQNNTLILWMFVLFEFESEFKKNKHR